MTDLEKRLIVISHLGITIQHQSGHRFIESNDFRLEELLEKNGVLLNNKIYGTVQDALDIIDECLVLCGMPKLIDNFWMDESDCIGTHGIPHNRITVTEPGKGGLV